MRTALVLTALSVGSLAGPAVSAALAAEFHVNSTTDRPSAAPVGGLCSTGFTLPGGTPECTLRAAVQAVDALPGTHTIVVPSGTYLLTASTLDPSDEDSRETAGRLSVLDAAASGDLDVGTDLLSAEGRGVTIRGEGATPPVIDGDHHDRVFHVMGDVTLVLSNLVVQNGATSAMGGGIRVDSAATASFEDVVVADNVADPAVGLGGGLWLNSVSLVRLHRCVFRNNSAGGGGGVFYAGALGRLEILDSTFDHNSALSIQHVYDGGGLGMSSPSGVGVTYISNSTFSSNAAALHGGGLALMGGAFLSNVTISGNTAGGLGGGFYDGPVPSGGPLVVLDYCTVVDNTASNVGGIQDSGRRAGMNHTIVAGNRATASTLGNCSSALRSGGYNLESANECGFGRGTDLHDTDPLLGPLADNGGPTQTHALMPGSPAIDSGQATISLTPWDLFPFPMDQRGVRRPQGRATDRGAYEAAVTTVAWVPVHFPARLSPVARLLQFRMPVALAGDPTARILDVAPAQGVDGLKVALGKDGRSLLAEATLSAPLRVGGPNGPARREPVLFSVRVEKSWRTPLSLTLGESELDLKVPAGHEVVVGRRCAGNRSEEGCDKGFE